jgi:hypothetical protein
MSTRVAARRQASVVQSDDERTMTLLFAKARVCDAYRDWLHTPDRERRTLVTSALLELDALEPKARRRRAR